MERNNPIYRQEAEINGHGFQRIRLNVITRYRGAKQLENRISNLAGRRQKSPGAADWRGPRVLFGGPPRVSDCKSREKGVAASLAGWKAGQEGNLSRGAAQSLFQKAPGF